MMKDHVASALKTSKAIVVFTKKDGTERTMFCTLMPEFISEKEMEEGLKRKTNDNVVSVWDLEKSAWRSFRVDSIIKISYHD